MAIYKRNKTWWTDFSVNGQRFRESLGVTDWREAQAREKELIVQASQGNIAQSSQKFARLPFSEAADRYIADRLPHLSASSIRTERERLKPLRDYFAAVTLIHISSEVIRAYVARRKRAGISNRTVNLETGILRRILKRAKLWQRVADDIEPLPERHDVGRAMSNEEKVRLTKAAGSKPEWQMARLAMELALHTTMRACEIRGLVWRDIDFLERTLTVRRSKTEAGERVIPLNANAWAAVLELRERAKNVSGENISPDWFLFPHGEGFTRPDPTRPMRSWRTAWRRIIKAAGLVGFRFHDLRHHAITELAESRASDQTIMAIAGHVSARMLSHYSHVRLDARRSALDALASKSSAGSATAGDEGHVTNNVTNEANANLSSSQLIENMVDVTGIEPVTPCLQRSFRQFAHACTRLDWTLIQ
jgi:integrase